MGKSGSAAYTLEYIVLDGWGGKGAYIFETFDNVGSKRLIFGQAFLCMNKGGGINKYCVLGIAMSEKKEFLIDCM